MTKLGKIVLAALGIVAIVAVYGAYQYPKELSLAGSSAGTSFNTAKFAGTVISLAAPGANGTSTSILNTDAYDRYVSSFKIGCENVGTSKTAYTGAGLAALLVSVGTTTTSAPATFSSNIAIATSYTVATATVNVLIASSSLAAGATNMNAAVWNTGSYMTFYFNATSTATCTVGVEYFGS